MKNTMYYRRRVEVRSSAEDDRFYPLYLRAGNFRRENRIGDLDSIVKRRRFFFYCAAGLFFGTGLFFVLF